MSTLVWRVNGKLTKAERARVDKLTALKRTAEGYVDSVGLLDAKLDELNAERAKYADALRGALSGLLAAGVEAVAEGSHYRAELFATTVTTIDPARLRTLVKNGYYKLVRVDLKAARLAVGDSALAQISEAAPGTPRLCIKRKENGT